MGERELAMWMAGLRRIALDAADGGDGPSCSAAMSLSRCLREELIRRKQIIGRRVLVVDDDDSIRQVLNATLTSEGYDVLEAPDGPKALALTRRASPHVIVLDMYMPGMSGWDFAVAYRHARGPHAPIVLLTVADDVERSARDIGAAAFLRKPFDLDELLLRLRPLAAAR
ncbi:MAG: response regulator [Chloroflexota bacterium]|nr:response regulator [Chloroflexota bacterium]